MTPVLGYVTIVTEHHLNFAMGSISRLNGALIDGGVTDGKTSVFYSDVTSVEAQKGQSPMRIYVKATSGVFVIGGLWLVFQGITDGNISSILVGILSIALFGFVFSFFPSFHTTRVIVTTHRGKKKLQYERKESDTWDLGQEVAAILNRRKGGEIGELPTDITHLVIDLGEERRKFFEIDGDLLHLFESSEDSKINCTVDLRKVRRIERVFRNYFPNKKFVFFGEATGGRTESDVIFVEHSGQEAIHFIFHIYDFSQAEQRNPSEELVQAVNEYLVQGSAKETESPA